MICLLLNNENFCKSLHYDYYSGIIYTLKYSSESEAPILLKISHKSPMTEGSKKLFVFVKKKKKKNVKINYYKYYK